MSFAFFFLALRDITLLLLFSFESGGAGICKQLIKGVSASNDG